MENETITIRSSVLPGLMRKTLWKGTLLGGIGIIMKDPLPKKLVVQDAGFDTDNEIIFKLLPKIIMSHTRNL